MSVEQAAGYRLWWAPAKPAAGRPIQWHLALFGVGILVPVLIVAGFVAIHLASNERARYKHEALTMARNIADDLDRELDTAIAMVQTLALTPVLQRDDFAAFDGLARELVKTRGNGIAVRDLSGQQVINTRLPFGAKLPISVDPVLLRADRLAAETRQPVISDLLTGAVAKSLLLVVETAAIRNGEPVYIVNITLTPERILTVLKAREVPPEFITAVFDGSYQLIARSIDHEKSVGTKSTPEFERVATGTEGTWVGINRDGVSVSGAYVRTRLANWRVGVTVPTATLEAPLRRSLFFIAGLAVIGLCVSFVLALFYGQRLSRPIQALAAAALSLGRGDLVEPVKGGVREIDQVSEILGTASRDLKRRADERDAAQTALRQSEARVRRMAEEALQQSEERFGALVDNIKDYAIVMLDLDGKVTSWNKGAERIKGYRAEEIIGQHFSRFYFPDGSSGSDPRKNLETAAAEGRVEVEGLRVRKDGSSFWANVVITALRDQSGKLRGFVKLARDITERKQYESTLQQSNTELQAAVNELDAFSYSVSHDLRTPLRAIDGFSRILLKHHATDMAPEPREYLQAVRDNTVQMGHLVDDLLAFARLNRKEIAKREVPLRPIVDQIVQDAQKEAEGRTVRVTVGDLPAVWGDPALLKQVFVNLIDNAFKYSRKRADAAIEIGSRTIDGEPVVFVRDNGVGFDMKYTDKLFGVFQRLHRAEDFEGTGVGLAIVQRIVLRHGWRIWAEAAVDQGATFYFTTEVPQHA